MGGGGGGGSSGGEIPPTLRYPQAHYMLARPLLNHTLAPLVAGQSHRGGRMGGIVALGESSTSAEVRLGLLMYGCLGPLVHVPCV